MAKRLGPLQYGIIVLTAITALMHLFLGIGSLPDTFGYMFILNSVGYIVLLVALYFIPSLSEQRTIIRWLLIAYTAVTFILYFVFNWPDVWNTLGIIDKIVELVLIILLLIESRQSGTA